MGVAALSSAIALLEVVVSHLVDEHGLERHAATAVAGAAALALGLACAEWEQAFDLLDDLTTRLLLPLGGLVLSLAVGWLVVREDREIAFVHLGAVGKRLASGWTMLLRYVTPCAVLAVLVHQAWTF
ncbi:MAG: hypothetical protein GY711_29590 [bacterium]|nr:hypothetical protein [bacterium]